MVPPRIKRSPISEVRTRLMESADRAPGMGRQNVHPDYGAGRLNLLRLLS